MNGYQPSPDPERNLQRQPASLRKFRLRFQGESVGLIPSARNKETQWNEFAKREFDRMYAGTNHIKVTPCNIVIGVNVVHEIIEGGEVGGIRWRVVVIPDGSDKTIMAGAWQLIRRPGDTGGRHLNNASGGEQ
jgi:hypothetical protein